MSSVMAANGVDLWFVGTSDQGTNVNSSIFTGFESNKTNTFSNNQTVTVTINGTDYNVSRRGSESAISGTMTVPEGVTNAVLYVVIEAGGTSRTLTVEGTNVDYAKSVSLPGKGTLSTFTFDGISTGTYNISSNSKSVRLGFLALDSTTGGDTPVDPTTYTVTVAQPTTGGTITVKNGSTELKDGANTVNENTELTVTATPATGYKLNTVTVNGAAISGTTVKVDKDMTISATFVEDSTGGDTPSGTKYVHNVTTDGITEGDLFKFTGSKKNITDKTTGQYGELSFNKALKMESGTEISFNAPSAGTLTLVFDNTVDKNVKIDDANNTVGPNGIFTTTLAPGAHTITKGDSINLFYMEFVVDSTTPATKYTYTVNVVATGAATTVADTDVTVIIDGQTCTVSGGRATLESEKTEVTYTVKYTGAEYTAADVSGTLTSTNATATETLNLVAKETPTTKPVTVTVYSSKTGTPITSTIYYWTTTGTSSNADSNRDANEYKVTGNNGVIEVTAIANNDATAMSKVTGYGKNKTTNEDEPQQAVDDMAALLKITDATKRLIYVTADGYVGQAVTLPESGNINVALDARADVNVTKPGVYSATAQDIVNALLTEDALYAYQNPYIKHATVNGFEFNATGNQIFKVMQKVNTRNKDDKGADRNVIQATNGCTIKYIAPANGTINIKAANAAGSSSVADTDRGYTITGTGLTEAGKKLTDVTQPTVADPYDVKAGETYTITVYTKDTSGNIVEDGTINFGSIEFVPNADEVIKYEASLKIIGDNCTASISVKDSAGNAVELADDNKYAENSVVTVHAELAGDATGKELTVRVHGNLVALDANGNYTFTLRTDSPIEVAAVTTGSNDAKDSLRPMYVNNKIDFTDKNNVTLVRQNFALTGNDKVRYYADDIVGDGGQIVKLKSGDANNMIEVIAGEAGTIVVNFNTNDLKVQKVTNAGVEYVTTLPRMEGTAAKDVSRSFTAEAETRYRITASSGNAYIKYIELIAPEARSGKNIVEVVNPTDDLTGKTNITQLYDPEITANTKAVRIVGQLNGVRENNQTPVEGVDKVGIMVFEGDFSGIASKIANNVAPVEKIEVTDVYNDVYKIEGFDPNMNNKDKNIYSGPKAGLSQLNSYFDVLVYGNSLEGYSYCTYMLMTDGTIEYYNNNAELCGGNF